MGAASPKMGLQTQAAHDRLLTGKQELGTQCLCGKDLPTEQSPQPLRFS